MNALYRLKRDVWAWEQFLSEKGRYMRAEASVSVVREAEHLFSSEEL